MKHFKNEIIILVILTFLCIGNGCAPFWNIEEFNEFLEEIMEEPADMKDEKVINQTMQFFWKPAVASERLLGRSMIVWNDKNNKNLLGRIVDKKGNFISNELIISNSINEFIPPDIAPFNIVDHAFGKKWFVIVWATKWQIKAAIYDYMGKEVVKNTLVYDSGLAPWPKVAFAMNNEFVVTWTKGNKIYVQKFKYSNGNILPSSNSPQYVGDGIRSDVAHAKSVKGGVYAVVWTGNDNKIHMRRFFGDGEIIDDNPILISENDFYNDYPNITTLPQIVKKIRFFVFWKGGESIVVDDILGNSITFHIYYPDQFSKSGETLINTVTKSHQRYPKSSINIYGDGIIVWHSHLTSGPWYEIRGRKFSLGKNKFKFEGDDFILMNKPEKSYEWPCVSFFYQPYNLETSEYYISVWSCGEQQDVKKQDIKFKISKY
jgi:hypothetical protein